MCKTDGYGTAVCFPTFVCSKKKKQKWENELKIKSSVALQVEQKKWRSSIYSKYWNSRLKLIKSAASVNYLSKVSLSYSLGMNEIISCNNFSFLQKAIDCAAAQGSVCNFCFLNSDQKSNYFAICTRQCLFLSLQRNYFAAKAAH